MRVKKDVKSDAKEEEVIGNKRREKEGDNWVDGFKRF